MAGVWPAGARAIPEMEAVTLAVGEGLAPLAVTLPHPTPVAECLELILPNVAEAALADVALYELAADRGSTADVAIGENACGVDAREAEVGKLAHLALVGLTEETFLVKGDVKRRTLVGTFRPDPVE